VRTGNLSKKRTSSAHGSPGPCGARVAAPSRDHSRTWAGSSRLPSMSARTATTQRIRPSSRTPSPAGSRKKSPFVDKGTSELAALFFAVANISKIFFWKSFYLQFPQGSPPRHFRLFRIVALTKSAKPRILYIVHRMKRKGVRHGIGNS
jgi:hypothetical protein